jgi:hypothetical protein
MLGKRFRGLSRDSVLDEETLNVATQRHSSECEAEAIIMFERKYLALKHMIHILLPYNNDDLERDLSREEDHKCLLCTSGEDTKTRQLLEI